MLKKYLCILFAFCIMVGSLTVMPAIAFAEENQDEEASEKPSNLQITDLTTYSSQATLTWDPPSGSTGTEEYMVYVNRGKKAQVSEESYQFTDLAPNTGYIISVRAIYEDGTMSEASDPLTVTTGYVTMRTVGEGQQYATIQAAVDEANPGDVVLVKDGTYIEEITINRSGTEERYITIMAEGDNALINGIIDIFASYIHLAGFKMDGYLNGSYLGVPVRIRQHYTQVVGMDIRNFRGQGIRCEWADASHAYVADNYIYNCNYGFYTCSDSIFERNEVEYLNRHGASGDADYIRAFGINVIIRDNYCHGTVSGEHIAGAHVDFIQVFDEAGPSKNILVENNIVTGHYGQGIMMENDYYGTEIANISDWTIRNNVFRDFFAYAICGGKASGGIPNVRVENNLFIGKASNKGIMIVGTGGSGVVKNNIIINCGVSYAAISGAILDDESGGNIIYNSGLPDVMAPTDIIGLDPRLIDPDNNDFRLHPQSPAIDRGAEVDFRYDIKGNARPYGEGFDIGPYEFQGFEKGVPPIAEITYPKNGRSYLTGSDINIAVNVDGYNGIQRVEYFLNDTYIGQSAEAPFGFEIGDIQEGTYKLYGIAYDEDGLYTKSPVVVFYANDEPGWIVASDDTYIAQGGAKSNYNNGSGSTGDIIGHVAGGATGNFRVTYMKFDISSLGETGQIHNVMLNIYAKNQGDNKNTLNVYGVEDTSWAEGALTWNTAPQTDFSGSTPIASAQVDKEQVANVYRYYELNITDYVTEQYNNGKSHITLAFKLVEPYRYVAIQSKDLVDAPNEGPNPPYIIANRSFIDNEPPSTPQNLQGTALSESEIELFWEPSTDNTGVAGYTVYCNDVEIATLNSDDYLGYVVGGLTAETTYSFSVKAFDAAGNISGRSDEITVTTLSEPIVQPGQILPIDDTYIWQGNPNINYNNGSGSTGDIIGHVAGGATGNSRLTYMKFDISSLDEIGQIDNVVLNIYAKNQGNYKNTLNVYGVEDTSWIEGELTWNNAPQTDFSESTPIGSAQVDKESVAGVYRYYEIDITDYVTEQYNNGKSHITLAFKLVEPYRSVTIQSKDLVDTPNEGPNPPYLIVNQGEGDTPVLAESVNIQEDNITLDVGDTHTLAATVFPENAANKELEWESSDPLVAAVDANGLVSAVSAGTATITVKVAGTGIQDTCTVTVQPAQAKSMTITAPDEIAPNNDFSAIIGFNLPDTILTAGMTITYNPELLLYKGYEQIDGGLFVAGIAHEETTGTITLLFGGSGAIEKDTPFVKLNFTSKDSGGTCVIAITAAELLDVPGNSIFPDLASKTVFVNNTVPGDANNDGVNNLRDLHFVSTHFWKDTESEDWDVVKAADFNNDGHIGIEDLVYVAGKILQQ